MQFTIETAGKFLRQVEPSSTKRAFKKVEYTICVTDNKEKK